LAAVTTGSQDGLQSHRRSNSSRLVLGDSVSDIGGGSQISRLHFVDEQATRPGGSLPTPRDIDAALDIATALPSARSFARVAVGMDGAIPDVATSTRKIRPTTMSKPKIITAGTEVRGEKKQVQVSTALAATVPTATVAGSTFPSSHFSSADTVLLSHPSTKQMHQRSGQGYRACVRYA